MENNNKEIKKDSTDVKLDEAIKQAQRAEGYLICITRLNSEKLQHQTFTRSFRRNDITSSLDQWNEDLQAQIQGI